MVPHFSWMVWNGTLFPGNTFWGFWYPVTLETSICHYISTLPGWWLSHPSEKYEVVNWDNYSQLIWKNDPVMFRSSPPTSYISYRSPKSRGVPPNYPAIGLLWKPPFSRSLLKYSNIYKIHPHCIWPSGILTICYRRSYFFYGKIHYDHYFYGHVQ